jgi:hypothetical protein
MLKSIELDNALKFMKLIFLLLFYAVFSDNPNNTTPQTRHAETRQFFNAHTHVAHHTARVNQPRRVAA